MNYEYDDYYDDEWRYGDIETSNEYQKQEIIVVCTGYMDICADICTVLTLYLATMYDVLIIVNVEFAIHRQITIIVYPEILQCILLFYNTVRST